MTSAPRPIFYAVIDTVDTPIRADRWMAQTGGCWMAVAPGESEADWFEDCDPADFPSPRVLPIDSIPTTGTLVYMTSQFDTVECDAATRTIRRIN
jgi:hypothetical protein